MCLDHSEKNIFIIIIIIYCVACVSTFQWWDPTSTMNSSWSTSTTFGAYSRSPSRAATLRRCSCSRCMRATSGSCPMWWARAASDSSRPIACSWSRHWPFRCIRRRMSARRIWSGRRSVSKRSTARTER